MTQPVATTDLSELVESLKREVAVPGTFAGLFPTTTDDDLTAALMDAFAQVQLDGFLSANTMDEDGFVDPPLSRGAEALVVIYAGIRFLTAMLINRTSHTRYEASGAVYEQDYAGSVLTQALKDLRAKKQDLLASAQAAARALTGITMVDAYVLRAVGDTSMTSLELTYSPGRL